MKKLIIFLLPLVLSASSLYLPIDNPLMDDVEKMAVLANMPTAKKPYSLKMVRSYNERIKNDHPLLYTRIDNEAARLSGLFSKERIKATLSYGSGERTIPNSRGKDVNSSYDLHAAYLLNPSDYFQASFDINLYEKDDELKVASNNSYISLGWDYFQLDAGYRDHWFGPSYNSAIAFSTNALNAPSLTLSNVSPMTSWEINYEIMLTSLDTTQGISYSGTRHTGNPKVFGFHADLSFTDWLTFAVNRMFLFGGGPRREDLSGLLKAFFDPESADNTSQTLTSDDEYGNQLTTISVESKFQGPVPFKIYTEIGAEDTAGDRVNKWKKFSPSDFYKILPGFGNGATTTGIFFPFFFDKKISFLYEYTEMQNVWYIHNLYSDGYRNDHNVLGHWVGDAKIFGDEAGSQVHTIKTTYQFEQGEIQIELNDYVHEYYTVNDYDEGYDIRLTSRYHEYEISLFNGHSALKKDFTQLSLSYYWK